MITKPKLWLILSFIVIIGSLIIIIIGKPTWSIDFIGGSLFEISVNNEMSLSDLREIFMDIIDPSVTVQATQDGTVIIRTFPLNEVDHQRILNSMREKQLIVDELRFESIGPTIGAELRRKSMIAIIAVVISLVGYLAYTFRDASGMISSWKFGVAAVYALIHDLLFVTALFVLLGKTLGVVVDTMFVTAMLALLGYSVNDTIVIFNRLKIEWQSNRQKNQLLKVLDEAVKLSLIRSLNTSLTTLLVLISLLLVGGSTIRWFIVALTAGTIVGAYSSLFVAPPILYFLAKNK